jgi:ADP-heptose:LPS heptosyltransferase
MSTPPHVLFARLDNAGDVLLTGPAVRAVARSAGRVTMLCGPAGRAAAELLPGVDDVLVFDAPWVSYDPPPVDAAAIDDLVRQVRARCVDQAVVATSFHQSPLPLALLLRLAGVPVVVASCDDYPGSLLDVRHRPAPELHEVERSLSLVATLGYRLAPHDDARLRIREPLARHRVFAEPYVVVHPAASVPARGMPAGLARDAVRRLVADGWRVAVTGTATDAATTRAVSTAAGSHVVDLAGATDLAGLAGILRHAAAVVVGNTGPAHLAAAVGTPVVSVFAPVVPSERWQPWGVPVALLGDQQIGCAGCRARTCPLVGQPCTACVTADDIVAAVRRVSAARNGTAPHATTPRPRAAEEEAASCVR